MRLIDITGSIQEGMWDYGYPLPPITIEPVADLDQTGWKGHKLALHTLAGTYIETADHLFANREQISEVPIERFFARAVVAQLSDKLPLEPITSEELIAAVGERLKPGDALLVSCGWDRKWQDSDFVTQCPYFLQEAMEWIIQQDVSILGVDIPCAQDPRSDDGTLNRMFFQRDRLLLAPLIRLREAGNDPYTLIALPLLIPGVCGTPCRAVLIQM